MYRAICLAIVLSVPLAGGCATLLRGSHQNMEFRTNPTGAVVDVDGVAHTSPVRIDLARKDVHHVVISMDGYRTLKFSISPMWDGISLIGNIILPGGSVGLVYDTATGADKTFFKLATINLVPATQPDEPPLVLNDFKGHLLTNTQVAAAQRADRLDRSQFFRGQP